MMERAENASNKTAASSTSVSCQPALRHTSTHRTMVAYLFQSQTDIRWTESSIQLHRKLFGTYDCKEHFPAWKVTKGTMEEAAAWFKLDAVILSLDQFSH